MVPVLILLDIIGIYAFLLTLIHFPPVQNAIVAYIEPVINDKLTGTVRIGSFRTNLVNSISVYNIKDTAIQTIRNRSGTGYFGKNRRPIINIQRSPGLHNNTKCTRYYA